MRDLRSAQSEICSDGRSLDAPSGNYLSALADLFVDSLFAPNVQTGVIFSLLFMECYLFVAQELGSIKPLFSEYYLEWMQFFFFLTPAVFTALVIATRMVVSLLLLGISSMHEPSLNPSAPKRSKMATAAARGSARIANHSPVVFLTFFAGAGVHSFFQNSDVPLPRFRPPSQTALHAWQDICNTPINLTVDFGEECLPVDFDFKSHINQRRNVQEAIWSAVNYVTLLLKMPSPSSWEKKRIQRLMEGLAEMFQCERELQAPMRRALVNLEQASAGYLATSPIVQDENEVLFRRCLSILPFHLYVAGDPSAVILPRQMENSASEWGFADLRAEDYEAC